MPSLLQPASLATMTAMEQSPFDSRSQHSCLGWRSAAAVCLATGFGVGRVPRAPGTVGAAIWGLPLAYGLAELAWFAQVSVIVLMALVGIPICTMATRALGRGKDPGVIVLDEIVSMPMTFLLVPMNNIATLLLGFAFNRLFDITKPPPARQLEHLPDGLGVMSDDWSAGVYSCALMHLLLWLNILPTEVA